MPTVKSVTETKPVEPAEPEEPRYTPSPTRKQLPVQQGHENPSYTNLPALNPAIGTGDTNTLHRAITSLSADDTNTLKRAIT